MMAPTGLCDNESKQREPDSTDIKPAASHLSSSCTPSLHRILIGQEDSHFT